MPTNVSGYAALETPTNTYDGIGRVEGSRTRGSFSEIYVVDELFVYHVPDGLDLADVAPLRCAGVTIWSPLRHRQIGPGMTVGVIGIGSLGTGANRADAINVLAKNHVEYRFEIDTSLGWQEPCCPDAAGGRFGLRRDVAEHRASGLRAVPPCKPTNSNQIPLPTNGRL